MGRHPDGGRQAADGAPEEALRASGGGSLTAALALRELLAGAIDYAGLFPPASLSMDGAVEEFAACLRRDDRWALGRFVAPLSRWEELADTRRDRASTDGAARWPVSVVTGTDVETDVAHVLAIGTGADALLSIDSVETPVTDRIASTPLAALVRTGVDVFVEVPLDSDVEGIVHDVAGVGAAAKVRTGGTTTQAFPTPRELLAFLRACRSAGARFKATAGLHHPLRGSYRLTYAADSASGTMFGFLNVLLAATLVWLDRDDQAVLAMLEESSPVSLAVADDGIAWREECFHADVLQAVRREFMTGFGSCSFREPVGELAMLPTR